jgi:DNA-binding LacI/PurR family transcriptional regulator
MTTVRQPLKRMGTTAAAMLVALASGQAPRERRVELTTDLIVRESTAPPRTG